jgi:hypothetical protein
MVKWSRAGRASDKADATNTRAIAVHYDTPEVFDSTASKTSPNRDRVIVILHAVIPSKKGESL